MTEAGPPNIVRATFLGYLYRRLGKWQWRSLLAAIVATVGGLAGLGYQRVAGDGASNTSAYSHAVIVGLAFLLSFALFFWVRSALKKAAVAIGLLVAAGAAISYFFGIDIDFSRVKEGYDSASAWIFSQCKALVALVLNNFGGAASAGLGAWMGMRRGK